MMTTGETAMEAGSETGVAAIRRKRNGKKLKKEKKCEKKEIMAAKPPSVNVLGPSPKSLKKVKKMKQKTRKQCDASVPAVDEMAPVKLKRKRLTKKGEKSKEKRKKEKNSAPPPPPESNEQQIDDRAEDVSHKRKHLEKNGDVSALPKKHKKKRKKEKSKTAETSPPKKEEMPRENEEKATDVTPSEAMDEKPEPATKSVQSTTRSFRRVTDEEWLGKKGAWDNSYEATFGSSGWGAKAQQVLATVRGKNFRHEKTKKKRGTYFGGKISADVINSIKFDSDED